MKPPLPSSFIAPFLCSSAPLFARFNCRLIYFNHMAVFRLLIGCFHGNSTHPFRSRVFSECPSPAPLLTFQADLAQALQKLLLHYKQAINGDTYLSLSWICSALDMVISTQTSVNEAAIIHAKEETINVQQYMENSVKLLDVCSLFKETLNGVHAYLKAAKSAVKRCRLVRGEGDLLRAKHALLSAQACLHELVRMRVSPVRTSERQSSIKRLSACGNSLLRRRPMGENLSNHALQQFSSDSSALSSATALPTTLYAAELVTLFVFQNLSAAFAASSLQVLERSTNSLGLRISSISGQPAWERTLICIQALQNTELDQSMKKKRSKSTFLPPEVHAMDASLKQISDLVAQISDLEQRRPSVSLKACSGLTAAIMRDDLTYLIQEAGKQMHTLESSIARLQQQLESLFKSLLETRMALLDSSTHA